VEQALGANPPGDAPMVGDWETGLASWTRAQLEAGTADLHATARDRLDQVLLQAALERTGGHRGEAARLLGVGRNTITRKLSGKPAARPFTSPRPVRD